MRILILTLLGLVSVALENAGAADVQFEIGGGYNYFAGQDAKSLAPATGYLLRFGAESGRRSIFKWVSSLSLLSSQGTADFNDSGTTRNLNYTLVAGEFDLGFKLAFLAGNDRLPVQPYVGASGSAMSASFTFPTNSVVSATFPKTEAQNFYGYDIFVGVDVETGRDWGFNIEVDQIRLAGTVASQPFSLDSNRVYLNLFFRK